MFNFIILTIFLLIIVIILIISDEIYYRYKINLNITKDFVILITGGMHGIGENLSYIISKENKCHIAIFDI